MERINAILDDLIEIKIKQLTKITYDTELNKNGFDRTRQIVKLIEKEIADLNFNEEQRVLYIGRLMNEIITKDIVLYNQAIHEILPVDVTSEILEWADRFLLAWELKQTVNNINTKVEINPPPTMSGNNFQEVINNNIQKINEIYSFCIRTSVFQCTLQDFLNCISKANFSELFNDVETTKSKLKYTIYALSKVIRDDWYKQSAQSLSLRPEHCSGVTISDENWKTEIRGIAESKKK